MLRTTFTPLTFAAMLAASLTMAGCAAGMPDETLDEGEKQQLATGVTIEVPTVPVYFNHDNRLYVNDETPWVYGRFDLVPKGKVLIELAKEETDPAGPVGFKLYGVTATGKLRYLATVDGPSGVARATLRSTWGGTYVVEVVGEPHPAALILNLTCLSAKCTNQRQPGAQCGGFAGWVCADGLVCHFPDGSCHWGDPIGTCEVPPTVCPRFWAPQCGCDGVTYGNTCEALKAGATIDFAGACPDPNAHGEGEICGGIAGFQCKVGLVCQMPDASCDWADAAGVCVTPPGACAEVYEPVCGCDGQTYSSPCHALMAGATIAKYGECAGAGQGEGQTCGGIAALECAAGLWCDYPAGTCNWGDPSGVCVTLPETCPMTFAAVCGCDGKTYSGECEATKAGVRVDHVGGC